MSFHYQNHPDFARFSDQIPASTAPTFQTRAYDRVGKRLLDLLLIVVALPVAVPLVAVLALFVSLNGGAPFYTQQRVGRDGRFYKMWKLRSMVRNADQILEKHLASNPALRAEWDTKQKLTNDPRITKLGALLRRTSMDELPQLWNVARGDMSLVGPRPMMPSQMALYPGRDYYKLRPGITGSWQVSARNTSSFAERATYDASYLKNLSLKEDCRIIAATLQVVLRGTGC